MRVRAYWQKVDSWTFTIYVNINGGINFLTVDFKGRPLPESMNLRLARYEAEGKIGQWRKLVEQIGKRNRKGCIAWFNRTMAAYKRYRIAQYKLAEAQAKGKPTAAKEAAVTSSYQRVLNLVNRGY